MAALELFGVPPEKFWLYTDNQQPTQSEKRTFDEEPSAFIYELAEEFEALEYFCHDPLGKNVPPDPRAVSFPFFYSKQSKR
jgi:C1A family cysteine protease